MGQKSEEKRRYILEKARGVFAARGYRSVTMADIVEACGISRGGLYLYFHSTEEILLTLLREQEEQESDLVAEAVRERTSSAEILSRCLGQKVEDLFSGKALCAAEYEYVFAGGEDDFLRERTASMQRTLEYLLRVGSRRGELSCKDPAASARTLVLALEGMRILSCTGRLSREAAARDLADLLGSLGIQPPALDRINR